MRVPSMPMIYAGGALAAVLAVAWLLKKGNAATLGAAAGGAAVDLVSGAALGVVKGVNDVMGVPTTTQVVDWANSSANPMQPVGAKLGSWIFDLTHPGLK